MPAPSRTPYEAIAQSLLGIAASMLAVGGAVATAFLWDAAPFGARLAMVVLDATLALFVLTVLTCAIQTAGRPNARRRYRINRDRQPSLPSITFQAARRLATDLGTTLVRRRDGTYYMKLGPIQEGTAFLAREAIPQAREYQVLEAATPGWLSMLADSLNAELIYEGASREWYLCWSDVRETRDDREEFY